MAIPALANGLLPPGLHPATLAEIENVFVVSFPASSSRRRLFDGYVRHRRLLEALVPVIGQWLDGSFVTAKPEPGDTDAVTIVDGPTFEACPLAVRQAVQALVSGKLTVPVHGCDSYAIFAYPPGHANYFQYTTARLAWTNLWARTRTGQPKGFLEVSP